MKNAGKKEISFDKKHPQRQSVLSAAQSFMFLLLLLKKKNGPITFRECTSDMGIVNNSITWWQTCSPPLSNKSSKFQLGSPPELSAGLGTLKMSKICHRNRTLTDTMAIETFLYNSYNCTIVQFCFCTMLFGERRELTGRIQGEECLRPW